jgi:hypothetical protein
MASKNKTCDFCGCKCVRSEMVIHNDKFLCDKICESMFIEAYETDEVKKNK